MWLISLQNFTSFGNKTMVQNSQILFKPKPSLKRISFLPVLCFIFPFQKADPSSKSQLVILIATFSVWSTNLCWIHGEADVCDAHCSDLWNFDTCHPGFWESCQKHWLTPGINVSNIYWVTKKCAVNPVLNCHVWRLQQKWMVTQQQFAVVCCCCFFYCMFPGFLVLFCFLFHSVGFLLICFLTTL